MKLNSKEYEHLAKLARSAADNAYAPYSKFYVGAALLMQSGNVFTGCNIENASFGASNCAERTAVFSALAAGDLSGIKAVIVYTPTDKPTPPCGICRQVLNEFGPTALVISICNSSESIETSVDKLLPEAFGPKNL